MEDEYSSDVNMFVQGNEAGPDLNQPQTQQIPQISPIPQMQQPMMMQQSDMYPIQSYFKPIQNFGNFNNKENALSVIVITVLFMLFASHNFRKIISGIPFLNMLNGDYNITSLFIVGLVFAIIYTTLKFFVF